MKVFVLLLTGLTAATLAHGESYPASENFSKTYPVSAQTELSLSNINGSVEIVTWDKNEIAIEAEKRAADSGQLSKIRIDVDASSNHVDIRTEHERTWWYFSRVKGSVRYKLLVPATLSLCKIRVVNSQIAIAGVRGQLDAQTVNGSIQVKGIAAFARLHSVNGNIDVSIESVENDQVVTAKTVNGSCHFSLPATTAATIHGHTVNGNVKCAFPLSDLKTSRSSLSGRIGAGDKGRIEATTVNGSIAFDAR